MLYQLGDVKPDINPQGTWIAPTASVIGNVLIDEGASVWFQVTIRGDNDLIHIGAGSNIQDNSVLHTDPGIVLKVGKGVTVGHNVILHGCEIGDNSLIGMGSTILNRARIGENSIVGANSLVTEGKEFPAGVLIMGAPARVIRELYPDELTTIQASSAIYQKNAQRFKDQLIL